MTTIQISHGSRPVASGLVWRFSRTFRAVLALALSRLATRVGAVTDWHRFDERLLRDIGKSPADAETAALHAGMGMNHAGPCEALTSRGLTARDIKRRVEKDCYRRSA